MKQNLFLLLILLIVTPGCVTISKNSSGPNSQSMDSQPQIVVKELSDPAILKRVQNALRYCGFERKPTRIIEQTTSRTLSYKVYFNAVDELVDYCEISCTSDQALDSVHIDLSTIVSEPNIPSESYFQETSRSLSGMPEVIARESHNPYIWEKTHDALKSCGLNRPVAAIVRQPTTAKITYKVYFQDDGMADSCTVASHADIFDYVSIDLR